LSPTEPILLILCMYVSHCACNATFACLIMHANALSTSGGGMQLAEISAAKFAKL